MFNALNRYLSRLDGDGRPNQQQQKREGPGYGFQVLRNTKLDLGIEPWFDFIVGINGRMIDNPDPRLFAQEVRNCAGGSVALGLWSAKGQRTRVLHIPVPVETGSLCLSLQWTSLEIVSNVWHVLDVPANSPADVAGLLPYSDYVIGTPDGILHGESGLGELVEDYIGRPLKLWIYNNEYDVTREVEIQPSRDWGGEGALGCVLGYGALHRLPPPLSEPLEAPGETMFDGGNNKDPTTTGDYQFTTLAAPAGPGTPNAFTPDTGVVPPQPAPSSSDFLIPAQMVTSPPPPTTGGPPRSKKKERQGPSPNSFMDDYFAEEEKKSKELDGTISATKTPPPPPPKAGGGPPKAMPPPPKAAEVKPQTVGGDGDDEVD